MDNVVNFLLDYYIWILAVLAIIIITIIGFLVDSKQKRKKKELSEVQTVQSMPGDNINGNINFNNGQMPVVNGNGIGVDNLVSNNQYPVQNVELQQQQSINAMSNPVSNNNGDMTLNNQKPHFEPREVQVPISAQTSFVNEPAMVPKPVNAVSINTPTQPQVNVPVMNQNAVGVTPQSYVPLQSQTQQKVNVMPVYNNMQAMQPQTATMPNQNNFLRNGVVYNNQQPVNYQNVSGQAPSHYSQQPGMSINSTQVGQGNMMSGLQMQQPSVSNSNNSQPVVTTAGNLGIGFVTGESTSTGDSDSWNL